MGGVIHKGFATNDTSSMYTKVGSYTSVYETNTDGQQQGQVYFLNAL